MAQNIHLSVLNPEYRMDVLFVCCRAQEPKSEQHSHLGKLGKEFSDENLCKPPNVCVNYQSCSVAVLDPFPMSVTCILLPKESQCEKRILKSCAVFPKLEEQLPHCC